MSEILLVCTGCERHVKNGDCLCPFCGTKVACVSGPAERVPAGISRSALLALGAAGALSTAVLSSCSVYGGPASAVAGAGGYGGQTATATGQGGAGGSMSDAGKD